MLKKNIRLMLVGLCCVLMPVTVMAWQLSTRVGSGGGTLQVRTATPQTSASGTIFKTYTTHNNIPITLAANPGYKFLNIQINGSYVTPVPTTSPQVYQMGLAQYPTLSAQSVLVTYTPVMVPLTVNAGTAGGTVYPYGTMTRQLGTVASFTFTPNTGSQVLAITGLPASGYTLTPAVLPAPINTKVTLALTVPETPLTITGVFKGVVANAGVPQYVRPNTLITLDGTGSTIYFGGGSLTYVWVWNQTYGQVGTFSGANTAKPTFTTSAVGTYRFQVTVSNGTYSDTATTYLTVTDSAATTVRSTCQNCHQAVGVGSLHNVFGNWSSSTHAQKFVMCAMCHIGADTGGHPGSLSGTTVNSSTFKVIFPIFGLNKDDIFCSMCHGPAIAADFSTSPHNAHGVVCTSCHTNGSHNADFTPGACQGCHLDASGNVPGHRVAVGTRVCTDCHNPHSTVTSGIKRNPKPPVFNNATSANSGTLIFSFNYKDPVSGETAAVPNAYIYLHSAAKAPPMERFFAKADQIFGPSGTGDGSYIISGVPEGSYYIRINQRANAAMQTLAGALGPPETGDLTWMQTAPITITSGKTLDLGALYAYPFASAPITITGVVKSTTGSPLAGRYVRAQTVPCYDDGYNNNINQCGPVKYLALKPTDANGGYTLIMREPGTYYLYTSPCVTADHDQYTGNRCSYTPAPTNPVTVTVGETKKVDLVVY